MHATPTALNTLFFLISCVVAASIFAVWPDIDLSVSGMFYDGERFYLKHSQAVALIDRFGMWPMRFVTIGAFIAWMFSFNEAAPRWTVIWRNGLIFIALAGILGPGLVIEAGLKSHHGRARPHQVEQFGGDAAFTPFYAPSDACERNCSFPSGHAAAGFYFLALAFVFRGRARKEAVLGGLALGALNSFGRVAQGAHFLSDVVFGGLVMWLVLICLDLIFARAGLKPFRSRAHKA